MIRLNYRRVSNGRNVWHVSGAVRSGGVTVDTVWGDYTDEAGLREALARLIASKPRYLRVVHS